MKQQITIGCRGRCVQHQAETGKITADLIRFRAIGKLHGVGVDIDIRYSDKIIKAIKNRVQTVNIDQLLVDDFINGVHDPLCF